MSQDATIELRMPSDLYKQAKAVAETKGQSFEQLICNALAEALTTEDSEVVRDRIEVVRHGFAAVQHHYLDESGHLLEGIETNLRPLPLPGCIAAFEGSLAEIVEFLNKFEHLGVTRSSIGSWMSGHSHQAWESGNYLVMRTHKKRGNTFLYVLEIRYSELTHRSPEELVDSNPTEESLM
ncbi:MAG: hypothetical protein AB4040_11295 [Synechococcus sp.]